MSAQLKQQLTDEGTYNFIISEVQGSIEGIAYDDSEYGFAVEVGKAEDGALHIERVYPEYEAEGDEFAVTSLEGVCTVNAEFVNTYEEEPTETTPSQSTDPTETSQPSEPSTPSDPGATDETEGTTEADDDASKTGDSFNVAAVVAVMIVCLTVIIAVVFDGRRRKI